MSLFGIGVLRIHLLQVVIYLICILYVGAILPMIASNVNFLFLYSYYYIVLIYMSKCWHLILFPFIALCCLASVCFGHNATDLLFKVYHLYSFDLCVVSLWVWRSSPLPRLHLLTFISLNSPCREVLDDSSYNYCF